jgi:hypothetical protein
MKPARVTRTLAALMAWLAVGGAGAARAAEDSGKAPQTIQLEAVALPVIVKGALLNYVFVSVRLELAPRADGAAVRAKEQFFRDDLVRAGHHTSFVRMDDYNKVDEAKVSAEVMRFAASIVGPGKLKTAVVTKQVSQKMVATPTTSQVRPREIVP